MERPKIDHLETYSRDAFSIYALWGVPLEEDYVEIAAVVGIPPYLQGTAQAAGGSSEFLVSAWFGDSSDHQSLTHPQREEAEDLLVEASWELWQEHGGEEDSC